MRLAPSLFVGLLASLGTTLGCGNGTSANPDATPPPPTATATEPPPTATLAAPPPSATATGLPTATPTDDYAALSEAAFSIERIMDVRLVIDPADWDALRYEPPGLDHFLEDDCPSGPRPRPYSWYAATATLDGTDFGEIEVRKKGLKGSMNPLKTSVKLRFGRDGLPYGIRNMTLNNGHQDPSFSHECLTYHLFRKAGLAAPRCGLARLTVNGRTIGLYTHIEEIKPPMLESWFGDGNGDLFEITMADFLPDLIVMFEAKNDTPVDTEQLRRTASALEADDEALLDELARYIELDQFFTYWAMEVITVHADGYSGNRNNSYIYRHPETERYQFIPWGTDSTFGVPGDFFGQFLGHPTMPWAVYAHGAVARRLYSHPQGRALYEARLRRLLEEVWDEDELLAMVNTIHATVRPELSEDRQATQDALVASLREHILQHKERLLAELDQGLGDWDRPTNPPACAEVNQTFSGRLVTTFDSLQSPILTTGSGEAYETIGDATTQLSLIRGVIGEVTDISGNRWIHVLLGMGPTSNGKAIAFEIRFPAELFTQGHELVMDYGQVLGDAAWIDLITFAQSAAGFVGEGRLTFDTVDATSGGDVVIGFEAPLAVFKPGG